MSAAPQSPDRRERRYVSVTDTAKELRKALAARFPAVVFSVRCKQYSGGASIDVRWTDGPTSKFVDEVASHFQGATFDGSQDLKSYHATEHEGELVRWGADFVFVRRLHSCRQFRRVTQLVAARLEVDPPTITESQGGCYVAHGQDRGSFGVHRYTIGQVINLVLEDRSLLDDIYPED